MNFSAVTKLNARQWLWLLIAWWRLWAVQMQLRLGGVAWLMRQLASESTTKIDASDSAKATLMHESVRLAERCHPLAVACLGKSLVLTKMLQRRKIAAKLRVGVNLSRQLNAKTSTPLLASHAWVELGGLPVAENSSVKKDFVEINDS